MYTVENTKRLRFNEFALGSELRDKITLISDGSRRGAALQARTYVYRTTKSKRWRTFRVTCRNTQLKLSELARVASKLKKLAVYDVTLASALRETSRRRSILRSFSRYVCRIFGQRVRKWVRFNAWRVNVRLNFIDRRINRIYRKTEKFQRRDGSVVENIEPRSFPSRRSVLSLFPTSFSLPFFQR